MQGRPALEAESSVHLCALLGQVAGRSLPVEVDVCEGFQVAKVTEEKFSGGGGGGGADRGRSRFVSGRRAWSSCRDSRGVHHTILGGAPNMSITIVTGLKL